MKRVLPVVQVARRATVLPAVRSFNTQQGKQNLAPMVTEVKFQHHVVTPQVALLREVLSQQFALYIKAYAYVKKASENMQAFLNGFYRLVSILYERNIEHLKTISDGSVKLNDRIPFTPIANIQEQEYDKKVLLDLLESNKRILARLSAYEKSPSFVQDSKEGLAVRELKEKHVYASFIIKTYMLQRSL
jgi:hypothetical protein